MKDSALINNNCDKVLIQLDSMDSELGVFLEKKMTVRTSPVLWKEVFQSIMIPLSIYSAIYKGIAGNFKIISYLRAIRSHAKGKITILICEGAHLHVLSLHYCGDIGAASHKCRKDAEILVNHFKEELKDFTVLFWEDFVNKNFFYNRYKKIVKKYYKNDKDAYLAINEAAEKSYTPERACEYTDKFSYIKKAELDLIEMIVAIKIMYESGYKIQIYPGVMPKIFYYLRPHLFPGLVFINASIGSESLRS